MTNDLDTRRLPALRKANIRTSPSTSTSPGSLQVFLAEHQQTTSFCSAPSSEFLAFSYEPKRRSINSWSLRKQSVRSAQQTSAFASVTTQQVQSFAPETSGLRTPFTLREVLETLADSMQQHQQQHYRPSGSHPLVIALGFPTQQEQRMTTITPATSSSQSTSTALQKKHQASSVQVEGTEKGNEKQSLQSGKLLLSGAMSAVVSRTFVAPLERIKMELILKQGSGGAVATAAQVFRTEGVRGFWKGNALNILRTAPFKAVNFCSFDLLHRRIMQMTGVDGNVERFTAGAMAGIVATLVCFPLDLVRTRLMSRSKAPNYGAGPFRTLMGILKHEGPGALYTGCLPAVVGMAPAGAVFYGVYDLLKHRHLDALAAQHRAATAENGGDAADVSADPHTLPAMYTLLYGAMAGAASEVIVYPLEVVRRRMQMQSMALAHLAVASRAGGTTAAAAAAAGFALGAAGMHPSAAAVAHMSGWARVVHTCKSVVKADGFKGFYAGFAPNVLSVLPSAALSYYTYDTMKQLLGVPA